MKRTVKTYVSNNARALDDLLNEALKNPSTKIISINRVNQIFSFSATLLTTEPEPLEKED